MCELSPPYQRLLGEVDLALGQLGDTFVWLVWGPVAIVLWFSLCTQDRDEYFDPDLL